MVLGSATADIKEVRRIPTVVLDDVHGRHRKSGTIHKACDVAIEADVIEIVRGGCHFARVFLVVVAHRGNFRVTVQRVVVEVEFCIERVDLVVGGHDQWVDLDHRAIERDEEFVERIDQLAELLGVALKVELLAHLAHLIGLQAAERVDVLAQNFLRRALGHLFNVHTAFGRNDDHRLAGLAIDKDREIKFAADIHRFGDHHLAHQAAFVAGLFGDEHFAEHLASDFSSLLGRLD